MQNHQIKVIQIANCNCNQASHHGKVIEALCLNPKCQESTLLCSKCAINNHNQCRGQLKDIETIPMELKGLCQISLDIMVLQGKINQQFKELLGQIELMLLPLSRYQQYQNFTNLNEIGFLLRKGIKQTILQSIEETKKQIKFLLDKEISNEQIKQKQEKRQQQKQQQPQKDVDNSWFNQGSQLYRQRKFNEAIDCFDKAISIDQKHLDSWYYKGYSLEQLGRLDQAINCYEECNKISPNYAYSDLTRVCNKLKERRK